MARISPLRLGIIGAGNAAVSLHLPALLSLQGHLVVCAVTDVDQDRARAFGARFANARLCTTVEEVLRASEAVAILTPPASHRQLALAALRAGKHTFVEKPLALSSEEAAELTRAARQARLCAAVGHNLRFHRLVRRAAEAVKTGVLGDLTAIEMAWTSPASAGSGWRTEPNGGGGVIFDLGVHHVELARFLTASEFRRLSASEESDDQRASVSGVTASGVEFTARWTKQGPPNHTVRLIGTKATAEFAMYNALSWRLYPTTSARRARQLTADLFHRARALKSGGDSAESYRLQWIDFVNAVRTGAPPACPFEEAVHSVRACQEIAAQVPTSSTMVPCLQNEPNGPALSVILSVRGRYRAVRRTVRHLRAQTIQHRIELILLWTTADEIDVPAADLDGFHSSIVDRIATNSSVAAGNAAGARRASGPVVAFAEDHCFPEPDWAEALVDAHTRGYAAVGPQLTNANPRNAVSWCDFLIAYGPWMSPSPGGEAPMLPGHNSSYKRDILLGYGERLEFLLESETVLHYDMVAKGHRLFVEPRARTAHLNFALWRVWIPVQFDCGRLFAGCRAAGWPIWRKLFYAAASPLIPAVRLLRVMRQLLRPQRPKHLIPRLFPALLIGLVSDGAGQMIGYLAGPGGSLERLAEFERNRVRYIRPEDRLALEEAEAHAAT